MSGRSAAIQSMNWVFLARMPLTFQVAIFMGLGISAADELVGLVTPRWREHPGFPVLPRWDITPCDAMREL